MIVADIPEGLTFDDLILQPALSDVLPAEADTRTCLTRRIALNIPILSAAMDTVTESHLAIALSQQGGSDLLRYTQESGRVTLPATVAGPIAAPHVAIDTADLTKRAIRNAAADEVEKRLTNDSVKKGLLGLLRR